MAKQIARLTPLIFLAMAAMSPVYQVARGEDGKTAFKFAFGGTQPGYTTVVATDTYGKEKGFGFEEEARVKVKNAAGAGNDGVRHFITSDKPFYFSVTVPEGNYRVTLGVGDPLGPTDLTVKAELRRLMVEKLHVEAGKSEKASFIVNVRTPAYGSAGGGGAVRLKVPRESTDEAWAWDEKLTLEFNGAHPNIGSLEIERVDVPTIYLLGDSTVCDQCKEPWNSWGQMFTRFFKDDIAVANHAESGETVASSLGAHRFDKVYSVIKPGDYLFFQFGHNDMKPGAVPLDRYKDEYRRIIRKVKEKGATPVVVTSMERKNGITNSTLQGYPEAAKQVAQEETAPCIDLNTLSRELYRALGPELDKAFQDGTHNNNFGSYEISKLVLEGARQNKLELVSHIKDGVPVFDPSKPDKAADYQVPASPGYTNLKPIGD